MRRFWIVLLVVAVGLLIAVPAGADKPNCEADPDHHSCAKNEPDDEPLAGTTCSRPDLPWYHEDWDVMDKDFVFTLDRDQPSVCFDVMTAEAGAWYVTVTRIGRGANQLTIVPRDAVAPGDSCGGLGVRGDDIYEAPIRLPDLSDPRMDEIPAATVNACLGNADPDVHWGEFAELVELPGSPPTSEIMFDRDTDIQHPLAFLVFSGGLNRPGAGVTICVDLPPSDPNVACTGIEVDVP